MKINITNKFIVSLCDIKSEEIEGHIYRKAKDCLLDYLGVTLAGSSLIKERIECRSDLEILEKGDSPLIGAGLQLTAHNAALLNGMSSHIMELDDGHRVGMMHPGAPVITALLSIGQQRQINGKQLLYGIIMGYEAAIRLACAIQPGHKKRGYHATGTCGTLGAVVGLAMAMGLEKSQMKNALSAAATSAGGILEVIDDSSELKPYNVGKAAANAIAAIDIAELDFRGPEDPLGGKRGFLQVMAGDGYNGDYLVRKQKEPYLIESIYQKPYAACRHCHAPIEATLRLVAEEDVVAAEIQKISVKTYDMAVIGHDHTAIKGINSAKMSIPYSVAVAIYDGQAGMESFTADKVADLSIAELTQKVEVRNDEDLSSLVPEKRAAIVEIIMADGQIHEKRVDYPKGEPENPISQEELKAKFVSLVMFSGRTREKAEELMQLVEDVENSARLLFGEIKKG